MAKTQKQYYDEKHAELSAVTEDAYAKRTANTGQSVAEQNAIIDSATQNQVRPLQQQIDGAGAVFQKQYDANAIAEQVSRKQLEERMANLGLTDSGLNRTQQTALSVQRGNADAAVGGQMRDYVTKLENAINEVTVSAENQKKQIALDAKQADDEWYASRLQADRDTATAYAASMYTADQNAAATIEAARIKAQQEADDAAAARNKQIADNVFNAVIENGGTVADAMAAAYNATGTKYVPTVSTNYYNGQIAEDVGGFGYMGSDNNGMAYQPRGIRDADTGVVFRLKKSGKTAKEVMGAGAKNSSGVNIENQNVWTANGKYYVWNGTKNEYDDITDYIS